MRHTPRTATTLSLAAGVSAALVVAFTPLAHGDVLKNSVASGGGVGGSLDLTVGSPVEVPYWIQASGGTCDASDGSTAAVKVTVPAGVTVDGKGATTLTFDSCDVAQKVTFAASAAGTYSIPVATVTDSSGSYNTSTTAFTIHAASPVTAPVNHAPVVATAASDALVDEGTTITASGSFADEDLSSGDSLTLTATNTVGTFEGHADGSWTFSLPTNDDVPSGTVLVTATDSHGATVTDDFTFEARNVAPNVALTEGAATDATGCTLTVSPSWSDPGTADTHAGALSWGDGTAATSFTSPTALSHSYATAGQYAVSASVTDDDGGTGSASLSQAHRVFNKPSGILQPVNDTRLGQAESQFKLGSTIPVKITVADCGGASVASAAPTVSVGKLVDAATLTTLETVSTATPTSGTTMRYDATNGQYVYNLSTKNLSEGRFRITITDSTFGTPVTATVTLKK